MTRISTALLAWIIFSGSAAAEIHTARVVLARGNWPEAEERTQAEIEAIGLEIVYVDVESDDFLPSSLARLADRHHAIAAVRISRHGDEGSVDVWLSDQVTGKTSFRQIGARALQGTKASALVGLRVVELLNASLLEIRARHAPRGKRAPPPLVQRLVDENLEPRPNAPRWGLRAALGGMLAPPALGIMGTASVGGRWGFHRLWGWDIDFTGAFSSATLVKEPGSSQIRFAMARTHLVLRPWAEARLSPSFGVGGGLLTGWAQGEAQTPYRGHSDRALVAVGSVLADLAFRVTPVLRLRGALDVALAIPQIDLRMAGMPAARAGRPIVGISLGLEWTWSTPPRDI